MNASPARNYMDNLTMVQAPGAAEVGTYVPTFTEQSVGALETLDKCRTLLEMEYERSSRAVKDRLINPITQVRNALSAIKQITEKS